MFKCNLYITILLLISYLQLISCNAKINPREVKCLVCKATINEMEEAISLVDPKKTVDVSGFRMDSTGNSQSKSVKLVKSEVYLSELMENICDKMDDYAKARYKTNGRLVVMKLLTASGMNPEMSKVDFVQDEDLNKSLKHYCLEILDDHDEAILGQFMSDELADDIDVKICSEVSNYCNDNKNILNYDDYQLEEDEEEVDQRDEL